MMELLTDRIKEDMKASMKGGHKARLGVIRLILSAIKQVEVDERIVLDNERTILVLDKMLKQRRESIRLFSEADRQDLIAIEEAEIAVKAQMQGRADMSVVSVKIKNALTK